MDFKNLIGDVVVLLLGVALLALSTTELLTGLLPVALQCVLGGALVGAGGYRLAEELKKRK